MVTISNPATRLAATTLLATFVTLSLSSSQQTPQNATVTEATNTFDGFKQMYSGSGLDLNELTNGPDWVSLVAEVGVDSASHMALNLAVYGCALTQAGSTRENIYEAHESRLPGRVSADSFIDFGIDNCAELNLPQITPARPAAHS